MNPIIKFTTLFGLLAVELAIEMNPGIAMILAAVFFLASVFFVHRSFYGMRIQVQQPTA
jgi:K(+)-stimulated pyrophosphate-energized sodium pump